MIRIVNTTGHPNDTKFLDAKGNEILSGCIQSVSVNISGGTVVEVSLLLLGVSTEIVGNLSDATLANLARKVANGAADPQGSDEAIQVLRATAASLGCVHRWLKFAHMTGNDGICITCGAVFPGGMGTVK